METSREGNHASMSVNIGACRFNLLKTTEHLSEIWMNGRSVSAVEFTNERSQNEVFRRNFVRDNSMNPCIDLALNEHPTWDLEFNVGAASVNLDLSAFKVKNIEINAGAADIDLTLGNIHPETKIDIATGASNVRVRIPKNADCRVVSGSVLMRKKLDGFVKSGNTYRTENFGSAAQTITINVDGAVGSFEIIRH